MLALACSSTPPQQEVVPSAETYYRSGLKELEGHRVFFFFTDVDHAKAIEFFQEVIDNYPYSDYSTLAELKIADTHFDQSNYEEAESYYQDFVEAHPNHPQVPYAIYRNGLCNFEQMHPFDRDQEPTRNAIAQFQVLIERYPDADPAEDARVRLKQAQDQLAEGDVRVGNFYYEQHIYHAAIKRYQRAINVFPNHLGHLETMARIGFSYARLRRPTEAEQILRQVLERTEDRNLRDRIEYELDEIAALPRFGPRPLRRSCETDPNPACEQAALPTFAD